MSTIEQIKANALEIKNATSQGANTASKVGGVMVDTIDKLCELETEIGNKADANGMYHGLTSGIAENLMPRFGAEYATKEVIGLGGRKSGGTNKIDCDVFAKIDCIKGYTLMWKQMIPDGGTSTDNPVTIGGTYQYSNNVSNIANRPYLMYNPTDEAVEIVDGVSVPSKQWSVQRIGTETEVAFAAGWKCIDLLITFGTENGHKLNTTDDVAEAMGYVSTGSGVSAFEAWQAHTEQFDKDMAYSATTTIRNGRWDGLRSVGKDGDGNAFDFTRSIEQIRRQYFPDGMNGIGIGTSSEVCDTIEANGVKNVVEKHVFDGTETLGVNTGKQTQACWANKNAPIKNNGKQINSLGLPESSNGYNVACDAIKLWAWGNMISISFKGCTTVAAIKSHLAELYAAGTPLVVYYELDTPIITPITELNLTYPVSNTEGVETPVCEPSTNCSPLAANITYGLDAYATIVDIKNRVEALEIKVK